MISKASWDNLNNLCSTSRFNLYRLADSLTGLTKARFESQLVETSKALVDYAGQLAQDDLLPTRLPDRVSKVPVLRTPKSESKLESMIDGSEAVPLAMTSR